MAWQASSDSLVGHITILNSCNYHVAVSKPFINVNRLHYACTHRHVRHVPRRMAGLRAQSGPSNGTEESTESLTHSATPREGASTDLAVIWARLVKVRLQDLFCVTECNFDHFTKL